MTELVFSAASRDALRRLLAGEALPAGPHRLVILGDSVDDLDAKRARAAQLLESQQQPRFNVANAIFYGCTEGADRGRTAFLFPGFGTRHTRMLGELLEQSPPLREWFRCFGDEREQLTREPDGLFELVNAILASSLAMHELLARCGVTCDAMAGHSYGENAMLAAAQMTAGPLPVLQALRAIARAGYDAVRSGATKNLDTDMLALSSRAARALEAPLAIAVDNCPQQAIVAGPRAAVAQLEESVRARGEIAFRLPQLTLPVHTSSFPVSLDALRAVYAEMQLAAPRVAAYSCATAAPFPASEADARELLAKQWSEPVRFRETIERLYADGVRTFVEVGPGDRLAGFVRDTLRGREMLAIATNHESRAALPQLRIALAQLFVRGFDIDFSPLSGEASEPPVEIAAPQSPSLQTILNHTAAILGLAASDALDPQRGFFELGLTSLDCVDLADRLGRPQTIAFDYPTPARLAEHLNGTTSTRRAQRAESTENDPIAIVGIGCRFPGGADTPARYWQLFEEGRDAIVEVPPERWTSSEAPRFGGFLRERVDGLDTTYFGLSPREATTLDPQHRLLLEVSVEALEHAAIDPQSLAGSATGIFVGISGNDYAQRLSPSQRMNVSSYLATGNAASTAAGRLSFFLGTNGPSLALDTACSSSLVAVHLAVQSLRRGESDLALAGGVNLILSPEMSIYLAQANALSPRGRCRTFDASADGYVRAEGCGMVALKRLADARADGDRVLAVIAGSAINHDGRTSGLTVPNGVAQQEVIERALADARVDASQVSYVETHGTGTALGDPIEVQALARVFRTPLVLGAAKTNIGHLEAAAGVAGLIKVVLQMQQRRIAGVLHFERPNPKLDWSALPFTIAQTNRPWDGERRIAGVSSFGISGTNAHVIVEAAPPDLESQQPARPLHLLTLSAHSRDALAAMSARLADQLEEIPLADAAYTTNVARTHFRRHRRAIVCSDSADAIAQLRRSGGSKSSKQPRVAFLFSGQGSQYPGMARELFATEPVFRAALEQCDAIVPVIRLLDSPGIHQTENAQPALFAIEYALAQLWRAWGIEPHALLGHSVGEFAAACIAGVFTMPDALRLVAARGRLMQSLPAGGAMLVVHGAEAELDRDDALDVAAVNGPRNVVLSGRADAIEAAEARWRERGVRTTRLTVSHAFHSALMDPIVEAFRAEAAKLSMRAPQLPLISNVTGARADASIACADAWASQLRAPVRFADGMRALAAEGCDTFIEIGPRPVLLAMAPECFDGDARWLASMRAPASESRQMLESLAALYEAGAEVNWRAFHHGREQRRVALPPYPFQRERYWIDALPESLIAGDSPVLRGEPIALADSDELRFESRLSTATMPIATTALTIAILGASEIRELVVHEPLMLESTPTLVQTIVRGEGCRIFFRANNDWRLHADAVIPAHATTLALRKTDLSAIEEALPRSEQRIARIGRIRIDGERVFVDDVLFAEARRQRTFREKLVQDVAEREARIRRYVGELAATILHRPQEQLDTDTPLTQLGFDSLLATQFAAAMQTETGVALNAGMIVAGASISSCATTLLERFNSSLETSTPVVAVAPSSEARLSHGQRALWFLWALAPESSVYNVTLPWRIDGDAEEWRDACRLLLQRHPLLRATFPRRDPEPLTIIANDATLDWGHAASVAEAHELPFDLERGPLIRFRWCAHERVLAITMHHIVTDAWSLEIIRRELPALRAGETLPPLTRTYAEYVHAQRAMLASAEGERLLAFWREQLAAPLPRLELPSDRPRPAVQSFNGATVSFELPRALRELAHAEAATMNVVVLAAYFVLLHRLTGSDDVIAGVPTAGRTSADLAQIAGYFVDPVAVRARIDRDSTFRAFLAEVRTTFARALEHRDYPFALLVEKLRVERDPSRSPLVDVSFNYYGAHDDSGAPQSEGKFDLTLTVSERADGRFAASFGYNRDLFDRSTVERFAAALTSIADAIGNDPELRISAIPLQHASAFEPVLRGRRIEDVPRVWDRFEACALTTPDASALTANGTTLTYRQLHERAIAFSETVRGLSTVRLEATRSIEFVIGVLGALRAGVPYVPFDALTPHVEVVDDDLAYVIHTSGSTGKPKGVAIGQRALANYVASIIDDLAFERGASYALVSTLTADLGNTVLFPALCHGGHLHLLSEDEATHPRAFAEYLRNHAIDYLKIVPSHLAALTADDIALPRKAVILGGESASSTWLRRLQSAAPHCRFFNHYGPTETTIGVLTAPLDDERDGARSLPLRQAVANCDIYLLDDAQQPVPHGVAGELCIAGAPLAHGYINDADETARRFAIVNGVRLYRTGDLARMRAGGALEVLGRADRQVKLHGVRIELGHIEAALRGCANVDQAACVVEHDRLIAFFSGSAAVEAVREHIAQQLPRTMLPSQLVHIETLPLTSNGKIDFTALRRPITSAAKPLPSQEHAQDSTEQRLAQLWREILGTNELTSNADFFEQGGHSLLAVRLAGRIADEFGCRIPLATFFTHRTLRELASFIGDAAASNDAPHPPSGHLLPASGEKGYKSSRPALQRAANAQSALRHAAYSRPPLARGDNSRSALQRAANAQSALRHADNSRPRRARGDNSRPAPPTSENAQPALRRGETSRSAPLGSPSPRLRGEGGAKRRVRGGAQLGAFSSSNALPLVVPMQPSGTRAPLFFFPGAGGSVLYFHPLAQLLGDDRPAYGVQGAGFEGGALPSTVEEAAECSLAAIRAAQPHGPYRFAGHSYGALVAFEIARRLVASGEEVAFLGVIDNAAPAVSVDAQYLAWGEREWLRHIGVRIGKLYGATVEAHDEQSLLDAMIAARVLPDDVDRAAFRRFVSIYRANATAAVTYAPPATPLPVRITLFRASEHDAELRAHDTTHDATLGWHERTTQPVEVIDVPGTHITMLTEPHVAHLGRRMREAIETAEAVTTGVA